MGSVSNSNSAALRDCSQGICSIYCPKWCYFIYSPPPPSFTLGNIDDESNDSSSSSSGFEFSPLIVAIIGILASAFILVTYYTLISKFCSHRSNRTTTNDQSTLDEDHDAVNRETAQIPSSSSGLDESLIKSTTVVCKYQKRRMSGLVEEGIISDCSVCLSEFQENESLRLLPKCNHAFHLPCIDPWLKSHSTCPLCRSNIMEAPTSINISALEYQRRSDVVVTIIQSSSSEHQSQQQQQQQGVISLLGDEAVVPKLSVEEEAREQLDYCTSRSVYVADILNESESDTELQREVSDIGSSAGNEGQ